MSLCHRCNSERVKTNQTSEQKMLSRAKCRAKAKGRDITITIDDIIIPKLCPILGVPLVIHSGHPGGFPDSPALDRFDSSKGYTPDNVWVISQRANQMKADASVEEMKLFAKWVLNNFDN